MTEQSIRTSTAARRLGISNKLVNLWKKAGDLRDPGKGQVYFSEVQKRAEKYRERMDLMRDGHYDPPLHWLVKPDKKDMKRCAKTVKISHINRHTTFR